MVLWSNNLKLKIRREHPLSANSINQKGKSNEGVAQ